MKKFLTVVALLGLFMSVSPAARAAEVVQTPSATCESVSNNPNGVLFIGDSITASGYSNITQKFNSVNRPVCVNGLSGRGIADGVEVLRQYIRAGQIPPTVVMALGTNDTQRPAGYVRCYVEQALFAAGASRKVYWVNVYNGNTTNPDIPASQYLQGTYRVNNEIFGADRAHSNMAMTRWFEYIEPRAYYLLQPDQVHPTGTGNSARTTTILDDMNTLWVKVPGEPKVYSDC